jgi:hypothetical protein
MGAGRAWFAPGSKTAIPPPNPVYGTADRAVNTYNFFF